MICAPFVYENVGASPPRRGWGGFMMHHLRKNSEGAESTYMVLPVSYQNALHIAGVIVNNPSYIDTRGQSADIVVQI